MSELHQLRKVNLNLLPVLRELLRYASVTQAAKALNLSQSSVSGSLRSLREHFDDELLATAGRQTVLTALARQLVQPVDEALNAVQSALLHRPFDPHHANVRFVIATADYAGIILAPGFAHRFEGQYPGLSVQITQGSLGSFADLEAGSIDLLLSEEEVTDRALRELDKDPSLFARQRLWVDEIVGIASVDIEPPSSIEDYLERPHAVFQIAPGFDDRIESPVLQQFDRPKHDRVIVPDFHLLPITVARSRCIAVVPESLARCYASVLPLTLFEVPYTLPTVCMELIWMARDTKAPQHRWLRDTISAIVGETDFLQD
ncbi:MAG: LysR family transcriptional regulator [Myxococcota bacterium]